MTDFQSITGQGVRGTLKKQRVSFGNEELIKSLGLSSKPLMEIANKARKTGATVMFLASNTSLLGLIAVSDPIKASTPHAIKRLHAMNLDVIMLTGDNNITATSIAKQLGISSFKADVRPEDKAKIVKDYQDRGCIVAMVGDGINDAPALSLANVGIAMGSGTDVAMESAGITLVKGDLLRVVDAIHLSKMVMANVRQNLALAFIYNAACVPIAAGILYPFYGLLLSPMFAAAAMSMSSISVIGNALRLNLKKIGA